MNQPTTKSTPSTASSTSVTATTSPMTMVMRYGQANVSEATLMINETLPIADIPDDKLFQAVYLGYLWAALIIGLPGNVLIAVVYIAVKQKRTSDWFIFFLSVYDCAVCVFAVPLYLSIETGAWISTGSDLACKLEQFTIFTSQFSSVSILGIIAVDRYLKICHPTKRSLNATQAKYLGCCTPLASALVAAPILVWYGNVERRYCRIQEQYKEGPGVKIHLCSTFGFFLCMFFVVIFCYTKVSIVVRRRIQRHKENAMKRKHLMQIPAFLQAISNLEDAQGRSSDRDSTSKKRFSLFSIGSNRRLSAITPWIKARLSLPSDSVGRKLAQPPDEREPATKESLAESKKQLDQALKNKSRGSSIEENIGDRRNSSKMEDLMEIRREKARSFGSSDEYANTYRNGYAKLKNGIGPKATTEVIATKNVGQISGPINKADNCNRSGSNISRSVHELVEPECQFPRNNASKNFMVPRVEVTDEKNMSLNGRRNSSCHNTFDHIVSVHREDNYVDSVVSGNSKTDSKAQKNEENSLSNSPRINFDEAGSINKWVKSVQTPDCSFNCNVTITESDAKADNECEHEIHTVGPMGEKKTCPSKSIPEMVSNKEDVCLPGCNQQITNRGNIQEMSIASSEDKFPTLNLYQTLKATVKDTDNTGTKSSPSSCASRTFTRPRLSLQNLPSAQIHNQSSYDNRKSSRSQPELLYRDSNCQENISRDSSDSELQALLPNAHIRKKHNDAIDSSVFDKFVGDTSIPNSSSIVKPSGNPSLGLRDGAFMTVYNTPVLHSQINSDVGDTVDVNTPSLRQRIDCVNLDTSRFHNQNMGDSVDIADESTPLLAQTNDSVDHQSRSSLNISQCSRNRNLYKHSKMKGDSVMNEKNVDNDGEDDVFQALLSGSDERCYDSHDNSYDQESSVMGSANYGNIGPSVVSLRGSGVDVNLSKIRSNEEIAKHAKIPEIGQGQNEPSEKGNISFRPSIIHGPQGCTASVELEQLHNDLRHSSFGDCMGADSNKFCSTCGSQPVDSPTHIKTFAFLNATNNGTQNSPIVSARDLCGPDRYLNKTGENRVDITDRPDDKLKTTSMPRIPSDSNLLSVTPFFVGTRTMAPAGQGAHLHSAVESNCAKENVCSLIDSTQYAEKSTARWSEGSPCGEINNVLAPPNDSACLTHGLGPRRNMPLSSEDDNHSHKRLIMCDNKCTTDCHKLGPHPSQAEATLTIYPQDNLTGFHHVNNDQERERHDDIFYHESETWTSLAADSNSQNKNEAAQMRVTIRTESGPNTGVGALSIDQAKSLVKNDTPRHLKSLSSDGNNLKSRPTEPEFVSESAGCLGKRRKSWTMFNRLGTIDDIRHAVRCCGCGRIDDVGGRPVELCDQITIETCNSVNYIHCKQERESGNDPNAVMKSAESMGSTDKENGECPLSRPRNGPQTSLASNHDSKADGVSTNDMNLFYCPNIEINQSILSFKNGIGHPQEQMNGYLCSDCCSKEQEFLDIMRLPIPLLEIETSKQHIRQAIMRDGIQDTPYKIIYTSLHDISLPHFETESEYDGRKASCNLDELAYQSNSCQDEEFTSSHTNCHLDNFSCDVCCLSYLIKCLPQICHQSIHSLIATLSFRRLQQVVSSVGVSYLTIGHSPHQDPRPYQYHSSLAKNIAKMPICSDLITSAIVQCSKYSTPSSFQYHRGLLFPMVCLNWNSCNYWGSCFRPFHCHFFFAPWDFSTHFSYAVAKQRRNVFDRFPPIRSHFTQFMSLICPDTRRKKEAFLLCASSVDNGGFSPSVIELNTARTDDSGLEPSRICCFSINNIDVGHNFPVMRAYNQQYSSCMEPLNWHSLGEILVISEGTLQTREQDECGLEIIKLDPYSPTHVSEIPISSFVENCGKTLDTIVYHREPMMHTGDLSPSSTQDVDNIYLADIEGSTDFHKGILEPMSQENKEAQGSDEEKRDMDIHNSKVHSDETDHNEHALNASKFQMDNRKIHFSSSGDEDTDPITKFGTSEKHESPNPHHEDRRSQPLKSCLHRRRGSSNQLRVSTNNLVTDALQSIVPLALDSTQCNNGIFTNGAMAFLPKSQTDLSGRGENGSDDSAYDGICFNIPYSKSSCSISMNSNNSSNTKNSSAAGATNAIYSTLLGCVPTVQVDADEPDRAASQSKIHASDTCEFFVRSVFDTFFSSGNFSFASDPCLNALDDDDDINTSTLDFSFSPLLHGDTEPNQETSLHRTEHRNSEVYNIAESNREKLKSAFQMFESHVRKVRAPRKLGSGQSWFSLDDLDSSAKPSRFGHSSMMFLNSIRRQLNNALSPKSIREFFGLNDPQGARKLNKRPRDTLTANQINVVITRCESLVMDKRQEMGLPPRRDRAASLDPAAVDKATRTAADSYNYNSTYPVARSNIEGTPKPRASSLDTSYSSKSRSDDQSMLSRSQDTSIDRSRGASLDLLSPASASIRTGSVCSGMSSMSRLTECSAYTEHSRSDCEKITRRSAEREHNITKLLGVITFMFVISWSVSWCVILVDTLTFVPVNDLLTTNVALSIARNLFLVNHFCNILVYAILSKSFREKLSQCYKNNCLVNRLKCT